MKVREAVLNLKASMLDDLVEFIKIPSVIDETYELRPFGMGIDRALQFILSVCERLGFRTYYDPEGYYGYAEYGDGELIGILGHVDVVPEGDETNWKHGPFQGHISGGKIFGRGALDDKGPIIAAIYSIKALIDAEVVFGKRVRIIFGTDEENTWRGICKYIKKEEIPIYGFTPDSIFPVVHAEKGLLQIQLKSLKKSELKIKGGTAMNAVPESASYHGPHLYKLEKQLKKMGFDHVLENDELFVIGKSAHSAKPDLGINAIVRMAMALHDSGSSSPTIDFINEKIGFTHHGELIFGNCSDEPSGKLTVSVNQIDLSSYGETIGIDLRIPVTIDKKYIINGLKRVLGKYDLTYEEIDYLKPLYLPKTHELIKTLLEIYEEETGLDGEPLSTGGATYARSMNNFVAYGPLFPGQEKTAHQTDEYMEVSALIKCTQIYAKALEKLLR